MGVSMSSDQRWRVFVKNLETKIRIGIHPHEREPQRVRVNAVIEADYPVKPQSIKECFDYDHIHRLVIHEWPKREHIALLETGVTELLEYTFKMDPRVVKAKVSLCKLDIFSEAESVGVEAEWTREDFEQLKMSGT